MLDAIAHGYSSFNRDVLSRNASRRNYRIYKYEGYFANINSLEDYFTHSMELLGSSENRSMLFDVKNRPIYTKVRNSAPTRYSATSSVKNSLIADGCIIDGSVENSILFRGVKVSRGASIKNSILFQDTVIGENVFTNCIITDKNVVVRDGRILSGHESLPFFIEKGKMI